VAAGAALFIKDQSRAARTTILTFIAAMKNKVTSRSKRRSATHASNAWLNYIGMQCGKRRQGSSDQNSSPPVH
jgi:hypothetical protein